jgi:hypothetical protein
MMQNGIFHDSASATAHCRMRDALMYAAREQVLREALCTRRPQRASIARVGRLLIHVGQRLQEIGQTRTYTKGTVQW